ncbi:hypothetical protein [Winogradskyella psychrotolerans]|nr:hypothetical protein [Winogradskyella psychrotolerans]
MQHHPDERNQLAALHDRHKRFSMNVYDHSSNNETDKLIEAQKELKQTEKELADLMKRLHPKF